MPLNDGNCHLIIPVVKRRCPLDALPDTFDIGVFKSLQNNSTTIKHIYNESANIIEGYNLAFDNNDCWNFRFSVTVTVVCSSMVRGVAPLVDGNGFNATGFVYPGMTARQINARMRQIPSSDVTDLAADQIISKRSHKSNIRKRFGHRPTM